MDQPAPTPQALDRADQLILENGAPALVSRDWTARFINHYRRLDRPLINERLRGLPLRRHCVCSDRCWTAELLAAKQRQADDVTLPWVGDDYERHRVLLIANNVRGGGGLGDELGIVDEVQREMETGRDRVPAHDNSTFGPGCAIYADAVIRWLESGEPPVNPKDPRELAEEAVYRRFARLQTVKCSPFNSEVNQPTPEMARNCPETYLADELKLLRPRVIVAMGNEVIKRLRRSSALAVPDVGHCSRSRAPWMGEVLVSSTRHPTRGWLAEGFELLVEALRDEAPTFSEEPEVR